MPKEPTGKRPIPPVATTKSPSRWEMGKEQGDRSGSRGTKPPTGNRPIPPVARHTPPGLKSKNSSRPAAPYKKMATPKKDATTGKDRAHGGR